MLKVLPKQTKLKWSISLLSSILIFGIYSNLFARVNPKLIDSSVGGIEVFITYQLPKYEKPLLIGAALAKPIYRTAHDLVASKCGITNLLKELHVDSIIPWLNQSQDQNVIVMMALNDSSVDNEKLEADENLTESIRATTTNTEVNEDEEEPTDADEAANISLANRISSSPMFGTLESADAFSVPDELKLEILNYLTIDELRLSLLVSREWNRISEDAVLWQRKFDNNFTEYEREQAFLMYRAVVPGADQLVNSKRLCFIASMLKYTELQAEDIIKYLQIGSDDFVVINRENNISGEELVKKLKELGPNAKGLFINFRKLTLDDLKAITAFLKEPSSEITHLSLVSNGIDAEGAKLIADVLDDHGCKLTYLSLERNRIGGDGVAAIARSLEDRGCGLIHLDLTGNCIGNDGVNSLVRALRKVDSKLASLNLANNFGIKGEGTWDLADYLLEPACSIVCLNLNYNTIRAFGAESLAGLLENENSRLKQLSLAGNGIEHHGISSLASVIVKPEFNLIRLDISCIGDGIENIRALSDAIRSPSFQLEYLCISDSGLDYDAVTLIADALKNSNGKLIYLDLAYNDIFPGGVRRLADALRSANCNLEHLGLDNNYAGDAGSEALAGALESENCKLKILKLRANDIGNAGAGFFSEALVNNNCQLLKLNLWGNQISSRGGKSLAGAIRYSGCKLVKLGVSHNKIGNKGAKAIAESLRDPGRMTIMCINANNIGASGSRALADAAIAARHQGCFLKILREDDGFDEFLKEAEKKYKTSDQGGHDQSSRNGSEQCSIQ